MAGHDWIKLLVITAGLLPAGAAWADPPGPDGSKLDDERLLPGIYPAAPEIAARPEEPAHPPFHLDWSIGLKGSYAASSTSGGGFLTTLNPAFTATHDGRRLNLVIDGDAEIARPWSASGNVDVTALRLGLAADSALDRSTRISGKAALAFSQKLPGAPELDPLVIQPAQELTGALGLGIERRFGKVNLGLKGDVERTIMGPTTRADTGITDNSSQNLWAADIALRAGLQVTPIFEIFGEAGISRDMFDQASPSLGVAADATGKSLRGGIAGNWNGILTASASIGVGHHDFDAAGLGDISAQLYDASLTYSPDSTLSLTAALSTNIEPTGADANGTARIQHLATAGLSYKVNSWLRLRASADWGLSVLEGNGETERRHGAGAGADYAVNAHTALSADYGYSHRDNSRTGAVDTHTISLGVTLKR